MARPALKRPVVEYVRGHYGLPLRRACRLVRLHRSVFKYKSVLNPRLELRERMRELARVRVRFGYRKLHVLLRREGFGMSREVTYRIYTEEGLQLRSKLPRRRKMSVTRRERYVPHRPNQAWSMDFVADQLVNGNRFRALTIVDVFSREALAIEVGQQLRAEAVVDVCNRLVAKRGAPKRVFVDNGSEFSGRLFDLWAYHHGVQIDFSRRGKPTDNCFIETFNGSLRDECLNVHWFESLEEAKEKIEAWRRDYNESRPHQALREQTPVEFAAQARDLEQSMGLQTAGNSL
jgi:putative transposase